MNFKEKIIFISVLLIIWAIDCESKSNNIRNFKLSLGSKVNSKMREKTNLKIYKKIFLISKGFFILLMVNPTYFRDNKIGLSRCLVN